MGYGKQGDFNVTWKDHEEDDALIVSTEFIVNFVEELGDDFRYKVCVYLTTGKILIQGNAYESWCDTEFLKCRNMVDKLIGPQEGVERTLSDLAKNAKATATNRGDPCLLNTDLAQEDSDETELLKPYPPSTTHTFVPPSTVMLGSDKQRVINSELHRTSDRDSSKQVEVDLVKTFERSFSQISNRMDVFEDSVLKLSSTVTSFLNTVTKPSQNRDIERLNEKINNLERESESNKNQVSELSKQNIALRRKNEELENRSSEWEQKNRKLLDDLESTKFNSRIARDDISSKLRIAENQLQCKTLYMEEKIDSLQQKLSEQTSELKQYRDIIKDKDVMIDKLQTQRYDSEGGEWCLQPRGRPALNNVGASQMSSISEVDAQPNGDIVLLHDSVCKHVNMSQLVAGTNMKGLEIRCSNIEACRDAVKKFSRSVPHIVVHVGINDLRTQDVEVVFTKYCQMVRDIADKSEKVTISLLLPCDEQPLSSRVVALNNRLTTEYVKSDADHKLNVCLNDNFTTNGRPNANLYEDTVHINFEGTKILCSNLKKVMNLLNKAGQSERSADGAGRFVRPRSRMNGSFRGDRSGRARQGQQRNVESDQNSLTANQLAQALMGLMGKQ